MAIKSTTQLRRTHAFVSDPVLVSRDRRQVDRIVEFESDMRLVRSVPCTGKYREALTELKYHPVEI